MAKKTTRKSQPQKKKESRSERGLWKGSISFGLVNIPVRVVSAKERQELHFSMLDPSNLAKVGYKYYNKATGEEISRGQTVKGFEYEKGSYVVLSEEEFKKAYPKATQTIEIENFVELDEIDPVYFEKAYYLLPLKGGEKGYRLLTQALSKQKRVAIAKFVLHTKQHLVAILARGEYLLLEILKFAEEVKDLTELEQKDADIPQAKLQEREIEMAEQIIESMTEKWTPEKYEDTFREDIMKLVKAKVKAGKVQEILDVPASGQDEDLGNVTDLMPLLKKSLALKKPAQSKQRRAT